MGCGESKQAVATENTLTKSKGKNLENNPPVEKPTNDDANLKNINANENEKSEDGNENPCKKKDEIEKEVVDHGNKESGVEKKIEEAFVVVEEKIKGDEKRGEELKGGEKEKLIVSNESPNKKVDDHEESIISGKSDYYSPRAKGDGNDAEEKDAEAKLNKEKEEVFKVDEEGKAVATPADEIKSSGEEKISAENETASAASTTDVKAS